jgi:hypothetical protein
MTRNDIGESVLCVLVNRGWAVFVRLFSFCISMARNARFFSRRILLDGNATKQNPALVSFYTQAHWSMNKKHWQVPNEQMALAKFSSFIF